MKKWKENFETMRIRGTKIEIEGIYEALGGKLAEGYIKPAIENCHFI